MNKKTKTGTTGSDAAPRHATPRPSGRDGVARRPAASRKAKPGPQPFSADELRQISTEITAQWFQPPEANRLTLLEIDPWRVHAYWHVADADLAAARRRLPGGGPDAVLVLRFTDLSPRAGGTSPPHERFDIEVQETRNNWYVGLWRDAKHYSAELGLRGAGGEFVALARSNEVVTPRGGPAPELEFRHLEVRPPRTVQAQPATGGTPHSDFLLSELFPERRRPQEDYPLAVSEASGEVLEEPAFPPLAGEADAADRAPGPVTGIPGSVAGSATAQTRTDFPVIAADEIDPYRALAREAKAELLARVGSPLPPVAADTVAPSELDWVPQPLPIPPAVEPGVAVVATADASPEQPVGASAGDWPHIPLEGVLVGAVFSLGHGDSPVQACAELVVHGRSASDNPLMLFGRPVERQADGSFTVRLALPQGPELARLLGELRSRLGGKDEG